MRLALRYAQGGRQRERAARRFQVIVIDPEREYGRTAAALGGQIIRLAPGSEQHINPFDLPHPPVEALTPDPTTRGDRLADHIQRLHILLEIMLADHTPTGGGRLTSEEIGLLDRAFYETYRRAGITSDVSTHEEPTPLLHDLFAVLESGDCGPDQTGLTQRLRRYVHGSLAGLFREPTTVGLNNAVVVFDIHDLETELRPIGLFLVSNYVWTQSFQSTIPRQLIVDEAATLYQYESGAEFLEELVRRARKHYLGVTIITQHPAIFAKSAIPSNCAVHLLMRQDVTSLDLIGQLFHLSESERQLVRRLGIGEALLTVNEKRLVVKFEASELEHLLATTNPQEIARWQRDPAHRHTLAALQQLQAFEPSLAGRNGHKRGGRPKKPVQALEALRDSMLAPETSLWRQEPC
jgi:type IV secretory pathway VirB4 component